MSHYDGFNTIYGASDGRVIHAECGGCSCEGSGSWSHQESRESAVRLVPEYDREYPRTP